MSSTVKSDVAFVPKVWSDHMMAYYDRKLSLGQLALMDKTLTAQKGETVTFPYFKNIGAAQEPSESTSLTVSPLQDDSFSCTVKEVGKAVGWKDAALRKSAAGKDAQEAEAQRQIGRVMAEKVDADLITLIEGVANHSNGVIAAADADKMTIGKLLESKIVGFGDKHDEAVAVAMHSLHFLDLMKDSSAGFLKADANDPFYGSPGFIGRILGMALFTLDTMPEVTGVAGATKKIYSSYIFKANPYGIYMAEEMKVEMDRDILARENLIASTMWYGVCGLHAKVSADDKRIVRSTFSNSAV